MGAGVDQKIDFLGAVMDGMEAPEEGDLVAQAMSPIVTDFGNDQSGDGFKPEGPGCGHCKKRIRHRTVNHQGQQGHRAAKEGGREKGADEKVAQISADSLAEDFLRMGGKESLQRNEDNNQGRQPKGEAENRNQHRVELIGHVLNRFRFGPLPLLPRRIERGGKIRCGRSCDDTRSIRSHTPSNSADGDNRTDARKQHQGGRFRHAWLHVHAIQKNHWRRPAGGADRQKAQYFGCAAGRVSQRLRLPREDTDWEYS